MKLRCSLGHDWRVVATAECEIIYDMDGDDFGRDARVPRFVQCKRCQCRRVMIDREFLRKHDLLRSAVSKWDRNGALPPNAQRVAPRRKRARFKVVNGGR